MTGTKARGKVVRRLGVNIFGNAKYDRLLKKKPHGPGKNPQFRKRGNPSEYSRQLLEKQKLKFTYGLNERQLRNIYIKATGMKGKTGDSMLQLLESRLDNIIYRSGFASTRPQARQMSTHGTFFIDGQRVDVPSYRLKTGETVTTRPGISRQNLIRTNLQKSTQILPVWISKDEDKKTLIITGPPKLENDMANFDMQLVVEYFAR